MTVDAETADSLLKLRDQMRHTFPDGDIAKIIKRAVRDLRASVEARKFGKRKAEKPKAPSTELPQNAKPPTEEPTAAQPLTQDRQPHHRLPTPVIRDPICVIRQPTNLAPRGVPSSARYQNATVNNAHMSAMTDTAVHQQLGSSMTTISTGRSTERPQLGTCTCSVTHIID